MNQLILVNLFQSRWARLLKGQTGSEFLGDLILGSQRDIFDDMMQAISDNEEADRDIYRHFRNAPIDDYLENGGELRDISTKII